MRIDADAGGTIDWTEFMNYMLIENNTLSSMKKEHFEYVKSENIDWLPSDMQMGHERNITCMITLKPEDMVEPSKTSDGKSRGFTVREYKKKVKFVTGSADGMVKVWSGLKLNLEIWLKVSKYAVTALAWMTGSKKLVVATADRMISFYQLNQMNKEPTDRIEDLVAVPQCLEYVKHHHIGLDPKKQGDKPLETLLWGDDLGIITMYNFMRPDWHICSFKKFKKTDKQYLQCCEQSITQDFDAKQWNNDSLKEARIWRGIFENVKANLYLDKVETEEEKEQIVAMETAKKMMDSKQFKQLYADESVRQQKAVKKFVSENGNTDKKKPTQYMRNEDYVEIIRYHAHWGWVTKLKYYEDLNCIMSSALDGFIHMHDLETLAYKPRKTFNLH